MELKRLTDDDIKKAALEYNVEAAAIKAVILVESLGYGFYYKKNTPQKWDDEILVRFEGHWFRKYTKGKFDKYKHLSYSNWKLGYKYARSGRNEFQRFMEALALDKRAALLSSSFGMLQTMGFNYEKCGYKSVEEMVIDYYESELNQLKGFLNYCSNSGILDDLRNKNWATFARVYNGSGYAKNKYDIKLNTNYQAWKNRI